MTYQPRHPSPRSSPQLPAIRGEVSSELALPDELIAKAKTYAVHARSERTRHEYGRCWRDFTAWCQTMGRDALPASVETVAAYLSWLASGRGRGKPLAVSSIGQAAAAIKLAQRTAGYAFDSASPLLQSVMTGIRRDIAKTRTVKRVKPLLRSALEEMLETLKPDVLRDARDACLLALGWAGALRRSELVGLDWGQLGSADDPRRVGFLTGDAKGLTITLMTSKASQDTAQTVVIPRAFAPAICQAVENWVALAGIAPGSALLRRTDRRVDGSNVGANRIIDQTVNRTIKRRVQVLANTRAKARGGRKMKREEITALVAAFAGHSMRAGYVTSAADRDVQDRDIMQQTRHKTAAMVSVYRRDVDKFKSSGLKGVGF